MFKLINIVLAFLIAWNLVFFLSIFNNFEGRREYSDRYHYYIGRAYPIAWSGVSAADKPVPFPIFKAPFTTQQLYNEGHMYVKVIDVTLFGLTFLLAFVPSLVVIDKLTKRSADSTKADKVLYIVVGILITTGLFLYFRWFPRI